MDALCQMYLRSSDQSLKIFSITNNKSVLRMVLYYVDQRTVSRRRIWEIFSFGHPQMHVFTVESQKSYDLRNVWSFNKYITEILFLNCFTRTTFSIDFIQLVIYIEILCKHQRNIVIVTANSLHRKITWLNIVNQIKSLITTTANFFITIS